MLGARLFAVAALAIAVGGCAWGGTRSRLARLQSQVGLLDERVTQLERVGASSVAQAGFSTAAPEENWAAAGETKAPSAKHRPSAVSGHSKKPSSKVSLNKPSTKEIQQALKAAGFYQGNVDGKMGPLTRQAIEEFQRINGLTPDGVVGRQTWAKLRQYAELSSSDSTTVLK